MSGFFDVKTRTLHKVESYAGAVKIPREVVASSIRVERRTTQPHGDESFHKPKLRRTNGMFFSNKDSYPSFFSKENFSIYWGNYDTHHHTNNDLIKIKRIYTYR